MYADSEKICWQCGQEIIILEDENIYIIKCGCGVRSFHINSFTRDKIRDLLRDMINKKI